MGCLQHDISIYRRKSSSRARAERRTERTTEKRAKATEARAARLIDQTKGCESVQDVGQGDEMEVDQQPPAAKPMARGPSTGELLEIILQMQLQM